MYLVVKLLHILFVITFLGNIAMGLFWHAHAARAGDPALLAHAMSGIIRSDRLFTVPSVFGIIATGIAAAMLAGFPILGTGWILWTLIAFGISGAVFSLRVVPLQRELLSMARASTSEAVFSIGTYRLLARRWELWGAIALLTPLVGLALMVLKPTL